MSKRKRKNHSVSRQSRSPATASRRRILVGAAIGGLVLLGIVVITLKGRIGGVTPPFEQPPAGDTRAADEATFIGPQACASCHPRQDERWRGSHHDLAMQVANEKTVLGDFDSVTFTNFGVTSSFYKRDGKFMVRTDGPDGALHDYEIGYTFGVTPLQQYLIKFPDGRMQVLDIGWDSRPKEEGGQRWFHLHPDEKITHDDILHWTGPYLNWNYMCAECHSTDLRKNFDLKTNTFQTTWSDMNVSCEACHGPGSNHVAWARTIQTKGATWEEGDSKGLEVQLDNADPRVQVEACARCHSRRNVVHAEYRYGKNFMDHYVPRLLLENLYYADGQILEEVYVYGSFLQSKKYHQGVRCTDCHNPHTARLRAEGNALCIRCHESSPPPQFETLKRKDYDSQDHHFHKPGSPGSHCVDCHMPATKYMVVDPRRDHSFLVPRPDLTVKLATPNACNGCHTNRSAKWAADRVARWYPRKQGDRGMGPHLAEIISAGRTGKPEAGPRLIKLAGDPAQPAIVRATALNLLTRYGGSQTVVVTVASLQDGDPLVRYTALGEMSAVRPRTMGLKAQRQKLAWVAPLLKDPVRAVRTEAARVLTEVPIDLFDQPQRQAFKAALDEYKQRQYAIADRPEAHLNLGLMHANLGQLVLAEAAYRIALRIDPSFVRAHVNLADLYRVQGRDAEGERMLRKALGVVPGAAAAHHALGLLLVRQRRLPEAVKALGEAATVQPENSRFSYVYGVALNAVGEPDRAVVVLEGAHKRNPYDRELLIGLVTINRDRGMLEPAIQYAKKLLALSPQDQASRQLLEQLQLQRDR